MVHGRSCRSFGEALGKARRQATSRSPQVPRGGPECCRRSYGACPSLLLSCLCRSRCSQRVWSRRCSYQASDESGARDGGPAKFLPKRGRVLLGGTVAGLPGAGAAGRDSGATQTGQATGPVGRHRRVTLNDRAWHGKNAFTFAEIMLLRLGF